MSKSVVFFRYPITDARRADGFLFNHVRRQQLGTSSDMLHEVYVVDASGGAHRRVDTWDRQNRAIISRKYTQLGEVKSETAMGYLNELAMKYSPGTIMADVPSNRALGLAGLRLQGRMVLEVPIQRSAIPEAVLSHARLLEIDIRDAAGVVYNP